MTRYRPIKFQYYIIVYNNVIFIYIIVYFSHLCVIKMYSILKYNDRIKACMKIDYFQVSMVNCNNQISDL